MREPVCKLDGLPFGRNISCMSKIVLIDGHSILNRAFYGVPALTNAKGQHTNAVFDF